MISTTAFYPSRDENAAPPKDLASTASALEPPNRSTTRRVLGDVSPNVKHATASLHPPNSRALAGSPLKRSFTAMVENNDGLTYLKRRRISQDDTPVTAIRASKSSPQRVFGRSDHSQTQCLSSDGTIEDQSLLPSIPEASPTEIDTPPEASHHQQLQPFSTGRKSFSSLINYDHSSQPTHLLATTISKAELLTLRLRVAMYKVRTNQIDTPFGDLRVDGPHSMKQSTSAAVQAAVETLRREAQRRESSRVGSSQNPPALLPSPILHQNSRYNHTQTLHQNHGHERDSHHGSDAANRHARPPPSSPPTHLTPRQIVHMSSDRDTTPRPPAPMMLDTPRVPDGDVNHHERTPRSSSQRTQSVRTLDSGGGSASGSGNEAMMGMCSSC